MISMKWCLGFVISLKSNSVILLKKSKTLHVGMWNGLGGKINYGESSHEAMVRESFEESKLTISSWFDVGYLENFDQTWVVRIYAANITDAELNSASIKHFWEIDDNLKIIDNTPYEIPFVDLPRMHLAPHTGALIYACLEKLRNSNTPMIEIREL